MLRVVSLSGKMCRAATLTLVVAEMKEAVEIMLQSKARVDAKRPNGDTALTLAVAKGDVKICKVSKSCKETLM